jgi:hypothetical protein
VGELFHPEVEIHTDRTTHRGLDAAVEWSGKGFDHLFRRYLPVGFAEAPGGLRVSARLEYVWTESGEVGDTSSVEIELGIRDGLVSSWRLTEVEGLTEI